VLRTDLDRDRVFAVPRDWDRYAVRETRDSELELDSDDERALDDATDSSFTDMPDV
jgi:hypothetical protein